VDETSNFDKNWKVSSLFKSQWLCKYNQGYIKDHLGIQWYWLWFWILIKQNNWLKEEIYLIWFHIVRPRLKYLAIRKQKGVGMLFRMLQNGNIFNLSK
jgi:hypothetical protein